MTTMASSLTTFHFILTITLQLSFGGRLVYNGNNKLEIILDPRSTSMNESVTFYETEFHDFPAPKREEVCFMEVNKKIRYQPPTRRVIKYHLSIIDLSFSNLYNYTIESEFAANYQNCSFYQEEDSLEVMINRTLGQLTDLQFYQQFSLNLQNWGNDEIAAINLKTEVKFRSGSISSNDGNVRRLSIATSSKLGYGATYVSKTVEAKRRNCFSSAETCHRNLIPCASQTNPAGVKKDNLERCCLCYPGKASWPCDRDGARQSFGEARNQFEASNNGLCDENDKNYGDCPYFCECGDCWMDTKWQESTKEGDKGKEEDKDKGNRGNGEESLTPGILLLIIAMLSITQLS